jgi:AcrR family transcriptional regulator
MTRDDWLDAAFKAVTEDGFDHLRVLALADTLGVTRGSFYWHFADHAALVAALLERWQASKS